MIEVDLAKIAAVLIVEIPEAEALTAETEIQAGQKCIRRLVRVAADLAKCLSSRLAISRFIAANALKLRAELKEGILAIEIFLADLTLKIKKCLK